MISCALLHLLSLKSSDHKKQLAVSSGNRGGSGGTTGEFNSRNSQSHMQIRLDCSVVEAPRANIPIPTSFLALSLVGIKKKTIIFNVFQLLSYF